MTPHAPRIAVVTGGNRGLGLETVRELAEVGFRVILAARNRDSANAAVGDLTEAASDIVPRVLDVTDEESLRRFKEIIVERENRVDVLVNNAGISMDGFDGEVARRTIDVNALGAIRVTEALLPLIPQDGSIVFVSSGLGSLSGLHADLRAELEDKGLDREGVEAFCARFVADVTDGTWREQHWPGSAYRVSKLAMNAYARVLARALGDDGPRVNAVNPGWVRTRMGGPAAPRGIVEGARGIVWAARLPPDGPTGKCLRDGEIVDW